jgi:hypothetical protein
MNIRVLKLLADRITKYSNCGEQSIQVWNEWESE